MSNKKNQVTYLKPDPPFLRRIREQVGYQDVVDVDTKKKQLDPDEDLEDRDDEKPTVVITENSNVSEIEQKDYAEKLAEPKPVKILFKKPVKKDDSLTDSKTKPDRSKADSSRRTEEKPALKRPREDEKVEAKDDVSKKIKQKANNNRLLSFDEDQDDDES